MWAHLNRVAPEGASPPKRQCAPAREAWHDFAGGDCLRRLSKTGDGVRADDGANPLPDAGSPRAAADLRLAELRSVPEISGAAGLPRLLAGETGRTAVLGHRGAFPPDQAGRTARRWWRLPAAL